MIRNQRTGRQPTFAISCIRGSISIFVHVNRSGRMAPQPDFTGLMPKRKQVSAHSKRFAHHDIVVYVGASMFEGATEPRASVWSARSLLPLWRVARQGRFLTRSPSGRSKIEMLPAFALLALD